MPELPDSGPLLDAAVAYLRALGIRPAVIGGVSVQHEPGERAHNHELLVRFTAVLPLERQPPEHAPCPDCFTVQPADLGDPSK